MPDYKPIEALIDHTKEYVETHVDQAKLTAAEKTISVIALLAAGATIVLLFACCLLFAGVAASFSLGLWLGKMWLSFLLVAAIWLLLGCIASAVKDRIIRIPVMNDIIRQLFSLLGLTAGFVNAAGFLGFATLTTNVTGHAAIFAEKIASADWSNARVVAL